MTMQTCIKCGGNAYTDADTLCAHDFGEPPEPTFCALDPVVRPERLWWAWGDGIRTHPEISVKHPTREGAIALWKDRWRWGHALVALFRWLHRPAPREPATTKGFHETQADFVAAIDHALGESDGTTYVVGADPGDPDGDRTVVVFARWRPTVTDRSVIVAAIKDLAVAAAPSVATQVGEGIREALRARREAVCAHGRPGGRLCPRAQSSGTGARKPVADRAATHPAARRAEGA